MNHQENQTAVGQNNEWLQLLHVSATKDGRDELADVSFSCRKKGVHGILGPSGAGKSATLELLAGLLEPKTGSFLLNGVSITESEIKTKQSKKKDAGRRAGYVPKEPRYYDNMTVYEIMDFVGDVRRVKRELRERQITEALKLIGLEEKQNLLAAYLSRRERKLLGIGCAIIGNPTLLLIDEPLVSGEDEETIELIRLLGSMKTVIVASSDYGVVRTLCDDVMLLSEGRTVVYGSFETLEAQLGASCELCMAVKSDEGTLRNALVGLEETVGAYEIVRNEKEKIGRILIETNRKEEVRKAVTERLRESGLSLLSVEERSLSLETVYRSLLLAAKKERKEKGEEER